MVAPLALLAGEALGAVVLPLIIEAFTRPEGPSPEDQAKIKGIIEREAAKLAATDGIDLNAARNRITAELQPALEKGFTQDPGFMQSLLTWGGGGIAGALGGRKVAGTLARRGTLGKGQQAKMQTYDQMGELAKGGQATELPPSHPVRKGPGMPGMDPDDIARLEANRSMGTTSQSIDVDAILRGGMGPDDIAKLNADRSMGGMTQPIDVDAILRRGMPTRPAAAAPAITKPGAKGKIAALKNKPAAATPEEAAAAADIEAMKGFKPSAPLSGAADPVAAARRDATNAARAARGLPLLPDPAEIEARVAARYA